MLGRVAKIRTKAKKNRPPLPHSLCATTVAVRRHRRLVSLTAPGRPPNQGRAAAPAPAHVMTDGADVPAPTPPRALPGFSIEVKRERETAELIPAGEVDLATVGQLQRELETLIEAGFPRIVVDLREVGFLDSSGLHALIFAYAGAQEDGWQLAIIPGPRVVQRLFEITGVIDRLPFVAVDGGASKLDS